VEGHDASFHTPAWHAARFGAASEVPRLTLDEMKQQKAQEASKLHDIASLQAAADRTGWG